MNVRRLRKLAKEVLAHPSKYGQRNFCGTAACLASHAAILSGNLRKEQILTNTNDLYFDGEILKVATEYLEISGPQAHRLFSGLIFSQWPAKFVVRYIKAKTARTRARVAAERIEHFIATDGKE